MALLGYYSNEKLAVCVGVSCYSGTVRGIVGLDRVDETWLCGADVMSTNYYLKSGEKCKHCCHSTSNDLHIGQWSLGWKFVFHRYKELGLHSWDGWKDLLKDCKSPIVDEYDQPITFDELCAVVESAQVPANMDFENAPASAYGPATMEERRNHAYKDREGYVFSTSEKWC